MTVTADSQASRPGQIDPRRRRRRIALIVAAAILVGAFTSFGTLRHFDHEYGPVEGGAFGGPYSDDGFVFSKDGFSYRLRPTPGASAQLIESLSNLGAHSVKVTSIERGDMVTSIKWSVYRIVAGGNVEGVPTPWQAFPAIVPAHGSIRLLITIHRPANCSAYPSFDGVNGAAYRGTHIAHWDSLLHSHATPVDVLGGDGNYVRVC